MTLLQTTIARNLGIGLSASSGQPKVRIEGSTIADNSSYGLVLQGAASATIEGTTISRNGSSGVGLWESSSVDLSNCTVSDNVIAGIRLTDSSEATVIDTKITGTKADVDGNYGNGISASKKSRTTVQNSTISNNALWGVRCYESATGTVEKSVIGDNGNAGVVARGSANLVVIGCTIARNAEEGIFAGDSATVEITNNQVTTSRTRPDPSSCCGFGINVIQNAQATIRGNTITQNANAGIILQESAQAAIQENTISDNTSWGIYAVGSAHASIEDNTITGTKAVQGKVTARGIQLSVDGRTTILRNQITQNSEYGIAVGFAVQVTIQDNTITGNAGSGIKLGFSDVPNETLQAEISRNTIQKNGSCGATVAEDEPALKITGHGNTISGNSKGQLCGTTSKFPKGFGGGR
jgi:parallel beta-helix repeat protein